MAPNEAGQLIASLVAVTREDIARAKSYVLQQNVCKTNTLVHQWLTEQKAESRDVINTGAPDSPDVLAAVARAFSLRIALYMAVWELVTAGQLLPCHSVSEWKPDFTYKNSHGSGGLPIPRVSCYFLPEFFRPPTISGVPGDPDVFLQGIDCKTLHPGIREAIEQALGCFRRGLYMPATAMLAAGAEATWIECGSAVAKYLGNTKLENAVNDQYVGISKKVTEIRKALEQPNGKALLKNAGLTIAQVVDAELWTTTLRDRRNALHWGKAKSFIAEHSDTANLLMAAPLHIGSLEAIRAAC